jgi:hypothetical protein
MLMMLSQNARAAASDDKFEEFPASMTISIKVLGPAFPNPPQSAPQPQPQPQPPSFPPANYKSPLDTRVTLRLKKVSIRSYLDELTQQSKAEFKLIGDFGECKVTAFMRDVTLREAMQVLLEVKGLTFQGFGNSKGYVVSQRRAGVICPQFEPTKSASGFCKASEDGPISLKCKDGPLSDYAEIVFEQSNVDFILESGIEDFPLTVRLKKATREEALKTISDDDSLTLKQFGSSAAYSISRRSPDGKH